MEDSFRVRVFGSLSESSSSLWSLTDEEIQNKERIRDSPTPHFDDHTITNSACSDNSIDSSYDFQPDPQNLDDDNDVDDNDDELEVQASIALHSTLHFQEEKDEYDKVAIGKEKSGDRLYMKNIDDDGPDVNTFCELPGGFNDATRDPRANHLAAKVRLEEDSEAAGGFHSSELSETSMATSNSFSNADAHITSSQDNGDVGLPILKSILVKNKNRDTRSVSKSQKRVRFELQFDTTSDTTKEQNQEASNLALTKTGDPLVPFPMDRSRCTHYTLESSDDMNEESNRKAYGLP